MKVNKQKYVVTIAEAGSVSRRHSSSLSVALASAMLAHRDSIPGGIKGVFLEMGKAMRDVFDTAHWDDETGADAKMGSALWDFLNANNEPGFVVMDSPPPAAP